MACATEPSSNQGRSVGSRVERKKRADSIPASADDPAAAAAGSSASAAAIKALGQVQRGKATFYDADGSGNCSFPMPAPDLMVVAPNKERHYAGSALCGACMRVTGAKGSVVVRVVDSCPVDTGENDCGDTNADLDLSAQAFAAIDDPRRGIVDVSFEVVPCSVTGPMRYRFKSGSSQYWTAIQILNHRLPVAKVEFKSGSGWVEMAREDDDFFVEQEGVGPSPRGLSLRVTASNGEVVEETLPRLAAGETLTGTKQFD
jgi:expansin (peptidoglycan-binding protein)